MNTPPSSQPTETVLLRLAQAIFASLCSDDPSLTPKGKIRSLASSVGGRNYLFQARTRRGDCLLKLRRDPAADATAEYDTLEYLPHGMAPVPWAYIAIQELRDEAIARKDLRSAKALDVPAGDGILMAWMPGTTPTLPLSQRALNQFGARLAQLHLLGNGRLPASLPRHQFPQRPSAMLRVCEDLFEELQEEELLAPAVIASITAALKQLHAHPGLKKLPSKPAIQALCHGDLRWHNMHLQHEDGTNTTWTLLDWEDAGVGDPAVDLALMVCRTPLSWWQELCVIEPYDLPPMSQLVLDRFFVIRPLVGLLCAMGALLDLVDVAAGVRPVTEEPTAFLDRRWESAEEELESALRGVLGVWTTIPPVKAQRPDATNAHPCEKLIAIDGPSVSFKSLFAAGLARKLGLPYYNRGTLFRYVALWAHCHDRSPDNAADRKAVCAHLKRASLQLCPDGAMAVGETRIEGALFHKEIEARVAAWAALPQIRAALQPAVATVLNTPCVLEGRDIGTVTAPHADHKFYITAPDKVRAEALAARGGMSTAEAKAQIAARDRMDKERAHAPLCKADDALSLKLQPTNLEKEIERWARTLGDQQGEDAS